MPARRQSQVQRMALQETVIYKLALQRHQALIQFDGPKRGRKGPLLSLKMLSETSGQTRQLEPRVN